MKHWTIILSVAVAFGLGFGCDRRPAPPEEPTVWDEGLDADAPCIYTVEADPRIIADQRKVSLQALADAAREPAGTTPTTPSTSADVTAVKTVLVAMTRAIEAGDGDALARYTDAPPEAQDFVKAMAAPLSKMLAFDRAGVQAYGQAAWDAAKPAGEMGDTSMPTPEEIQTKVTVQVQGDTATATLEGDPKPLSLVKKGGAWLVKPSFETPPEKAQQDAVVQLLTAMADAVDPVKQKIGQPGMTAKQIREEAAKAMAALLPSP